MKKIKLALSVLLMGLGVSSCNDFLTLMPLNDIVLENYWTNKDDVESVLLGAYASLESNDCLTRMSIWGEMRSDNITIGTSTPDDILQILRDNILSTNSYTQYKCFYEVINNANTVLHFAPGVSKIDPNYTRGQLNADMAEAKAIRALAYWYLIRAYKDVPFVTEPSIDDTKDFFIGQTSFDSILNFLIADMESITDQIKPKYLKELENTGRFTTTAIYAMLADMYLWKGDWENCVRCCEKVTTIKVDTDLKELIDKEGKAITVTLYSDKYPLYKEDFQSQNGNRVGNAYNMNFGEGNSFEVIFELPYDQKSNADFISKYYSPKEVNGGYLKATNEAAKKAFTQEYDVRFFECIRSNSDENYIIKYAYQDMECNLGEGKSNVNLTNKRYFNYTPRESTKPNWIIYRYSDVLLMEAEAKTMQAKELAAEYPDSADVTTLLQEAFKIVDAVNKRALGGYAGAVSEYLVEGTYTGDAEKMEELVLDERRRELMFEGKRWFDLCRKSLRDGNTNYLWGKIEDKFDSNARSAVRIKMTDLDALFFPFYRDEIKINPLIKQNPVYVEDEFIQKAQ